jgi:hypothetical protein
MEMEHKKSCNCCNCIWQRLIENQGGIYRLAEGKEVSYHLKSNTLEWIPVETTHNVLYPQSRESFCESITARINNLSPSNYPGTAKSYKWALLNDPRIWLS